jgi:hypothetical protein
VAGDEREDEIPAGAAGLQEQSWGTLPPAKLVQELFARDNHLLDLALDRYYVGDLQPGAVKLVDNHLADCAACRARADKARGFLDEVPTQRRREPPWTLLVAAAVVVALAVGIAIGLAF